VTIEVEPEDGLVKREKGRDSLFLTARIAVVGKTSGIDVRVRNLSSGGMMIDCPFELAKGQAVEIQLRNIGDVSGAVAWSTHGKCGVSFDVEIDPKLPRVSTSVEKMLVPDYLKAPVERRSGLKIR
jgi:hypothetical protein